MKHRSLLDKNPQLSKEWHPTKNGTIKPQDVPPRTPKKFWWVCSENNKHEWEASPDSRTRGTGCPYCCGKRVLPEESAGAKHPHLLNEWNKEKNGSLTLFELTVKSNQLVEWRCHLEQSHNWRASVASRTSGRGCPFCSGQKLCSKKSLFATNPALANEFHPTLNGNLSPESISAKSDRSVYWSCLKDASHSPWKAQVSCRMKNDAGCPGCRVKPKIPFESSLAYKNPTLAKQLHPTKNEGITADQLSPNSGKVVVWQCPLNKKHVWSTRVSHRSNGHGCHFCSNMVSYENKRLHAELSHVLPNCKIVLEFKVAKKINVDVAIPEIKLALEWDSLFHHKDRYQSDLNKTAHVIKEGYTYVRLRHSSLPWKAVKGSVVIPHKDEITIEHIHAILTIVAEEAPHLCKGRKFSSYMNRKAWAAADPRLSDEYQKRLPLSGRSLSECFPQHCRFWHPIKNDALLPHEVYGSSHQEVWWQCPVEPSHEWENRISTFTARDASCCYCDKRKVSSTYNLAVVHPHLLKEWAQDLNEGIDPFTVSPGTGKKFAWRCDSGHCWTASVHNRTKGNGCPYCAGKKASVANSLKTKYPRLAEELHKDLNNEHTALNVTSGSQRKVWWQCTINPEHIWQSTIKNRTAGRGCPLCACSKRKKK